MFKLSRYFSIASAIAIGIIMALFAVIYRGHERAELIENEERHNVVLARALANILLPANDTYIRLVRGVSGNVLRERPETAEIDRQVRLAMELLPVRKVKIYDPYGLTVYSSELAQIGESKAGQPAFERMVSSLKPDSKLSFRDNFSAISGYISKVDLVETYVPIVDQTGRLSAVVELYTDVSTQVARSDEIIIRVGLTILAAFSALYVALFLIVHRANRVLERQYSELAAFNEKLETRVTERTAAAEAAADSALQTSQHLATEIDERKRIEAELVAQRERLLRQQQALGNLIHEAKPPACEWQMSIERLMCKTAEALDSARASIWVYTQDRDSIECLDLYVAAERVHRRGAMLVVNDFPRYFATLDSGTYIDANNAQNDPRTSEFRDVYLAPNDIGSMLDVPLVREGKVSGVLCVEHIGTPVVWTPEQKVFASAIASLAALVLEERDRARIEQELRTTNAELKRATEAKSEFLATMSHEIRTPMNGVLGMLGLLLREKLETKQRNLALIARDSAEGLLAILNDILDFSKLNEGKVALETVDFSPEQILKDVFTLLRPKAAAKSLQLELQLTPCFPRMLSGDPTRLRQVFFNLIGNGIKFTQRGSVRVNASWRQGENDIVIARFEVSDTGVGIPTESVSRLFTRFSQADASTTRRFGGTGLGLAICKQLVELMHGTIGVNSEEGNGSTFWFEVPLSPARHSAAADAVGLDIEPPQRKLHILAADDNHVNLLLLDMLLTPLGHTIDLVADGSAALGAISNNRYDLVLMDVQMPELDGTTVTSLIRGMDGEVQHVPIIALTANAMPGDREQYLAAGMTDYVSKPIRGRELLAAIARVTGGSDATQHTAPASPLLDEPAERQAKEKRKGNDRRKHSGKRSSALPLIDHSVIAEWSSGIDQAAVSRLLEHVPDQSAQCLNDIKTALAAGDLDKAQRAAHRLKGMASNVGAIRLAEIARTIELETKAVESAQPKLDALEKTMTATLRELKKIA